MAIETTPVASESPSTPPSSIQRRFRKHKDSFSILAEAPVGSSSQDPSENDHMQKKDQQDSLLANIITTPLLFVSFLFSLFLVDRHNRSYRVSEHTHNTSSSSFWSRISLRSWLDPEPYQDPADTTWQRQLSDEYEGTNAAVLRPDRRRWVTRKKHRRIAKMEFSEAFEMRGTVMLCFIAVAVLGLAGFGWLSMRSYHHIVGKVW